MRHAGESNLELRLGDDCFHRCIVAHSGAERDKEIIAKMIHRSSPVAEGRQQK